MKKLYIYLLLTVLPVALWAQSEISKAVPTALPFLTIAPDAKATAMGDAGTGTDADVYSMYWNPAKYAFIEHQGGVALSYTPWTRDLTSGINLGALNAYYRLDKKQTLALGFRYFTLGDVTLFNDEGEAMGKESPKEFALDLAYARNFGEHWSVGVAARFLHSNAEAGVEGADAANAFALDLSAYYRKNSQIAGHNALWSVGLNIANIGTKISYHDDADKGFLPATLRLGASMRYDFTQKHDLRLALDLSKLMAPAPKLVTDAAGNINWEASDKSAVGGIFSSFSDGDEFQEIEWSVGAEYRYNKMISVLAGYHYQNKDMGNRQYFTCGLGAEYWGFGLNLSYLIPTSDGYSPLKNTFRVSLAYNF